MPITYEKESAPAQKLNTTNIIKTDLNTFNCKIGQTTNYSTKFFSMLCNYDRESREYKELTERIKLLRRYIGDSIDAGKGIKTKPFPAEWKSWKRIPEDWSEEQKSEQWFLNNLVEKRKPYFFVYIYPATMEEYKRAKRSLNEECKYIFGMNFNELKSKEEKTQEEKNFIKKYYNELPVTKTPCIMNKIAWKIEDIEFNYKYPKNTQEENIEIAKKLLSDDFEQDKLVKAKLDKIKHVWKEWKANLTVTNKIKDIVPSVSDEQDDFYINIRTGRTKRELEQIIPNEVELANYLVYLAYIEGKNDMKTFCWTFGCIGIVQTLKKKKNSVTIPIESENGIEYLGKQYKLVDIE